MFKLKHQLSGTPFMSVLAALTLLLSSMPGLPPVKAHASGTKIHLTPAMVTNESGKGDPGRLVDEQAAAGDPKDGDPKDGDRTPVMTTTWQPAWNAATYPASV
jgi:hypothetical protein